MAWEVIRRLRERHGLEPVHFVVTGTMAPHLMPEWQKREVMLKAMVTDNSSGVLDSLSRMWMTRSFFKSDLAAHASRFSVVAELSLSIRRSSLDCPITAFAARKDDSLYTSKIREWSTDTRDGQLRTD